MKKLAILIFIFYIFSAVGMGKSLQSPSPWKELREFDGIIVLDFMNPSYLKDKYVICPSTVDLPKLPKDKEYIVDMKPIRSLLEKSGIKDSITIDVYYRKKRFLTSLGKFEPVGNLQRNDIGWVIPKYKTVKISREEFRSIVVEIHLRDSKLSRPLIGSKENWVLLFKDLSGKIQASLSAEGYIFIRYEKRQYAELDRLLVKKQIKKAINFCKELSGDIKNECFNILGDALFLKDIEKMISNGNFKELDTYCTKYRDDLQSQCYRLAGEIYMQRKDYPQAINYFSRTGLIESNNKIGRAYFLMENYQKAASYYEKGFPSSYRAKAYSRLADYYKKRNEGKLAKDYYKKALQEYESLIKRDEYEWNNIDNNDRLRCRREIAAFNKSPEELNREKKLKKILENTAKYCKRLEKSMIHFFCNEEILEIYPLGSGKKAHNKIVYEYQLIPEGKKIVERRILLRKNGVRLHKEDAPLETTFYQYNKLIFGPIGFLDRFWQDYFDYKIVDEDMYNNSPVVVIEAIPLRKLKNNFNCGKIWVDTENYSIIKIQWEPKFILNNFERALEDAKWNNAHLKIDFVSEFEKERNSIRFPTHYQIAEYHLTDKGKKKVKAMLDVKFKKFMFFTVGTEVEVNN